MSMEQMLGYLAALEQNNDRGWFHSHRREYEQARAGFESLVDGLLPLLRRFDPSLPILPARELTFKLMRDTRFGRDKAPYNPAFRAHLGPRGKLPVPVGYYLMLRPGDRSFLGGGLFADMFAGATTRVRDAIAARGEEWAAVLAEPAFAGAFSVGGSTLKKTPRGYDPAHPQAEWLRHKSWYLELPVPDSRLLDPGFLPWAAEAFHKMQPFNAFLNRALEGFELPCR